MENEPNKEVLMKPHVTIEFGSGGHEDEYMILYLPDGAWENPDSIPEDWEKVFQEKLGKDWGIINRGNRFEIKPPIVRTEELNKDKMSDDEIEEKVTKFMKGKGDKPEMAEKARTILKRQNPDTIINEERKRTDKTDKAIRNIFKELLDEKVILKFTP